MIVGATHSIPSSITQSNWNSDSQRYSKNGMKASVGVWRIWMCRILSVTSNFTKHRCRADCSQDSISFIAKVCWSEAIKALSQLSRCRTSTRGQYTGNRVHLVLVQLKYKGPYNLFKICHRSIFTPWQGIFSWFSRNRMQKRIWKILLGMLDFFTRMVFH